MSSALGPDKVPPSDADIVAALLDGDTSALGVVYDRYAPALHTFAYSMVRNSDRAADVTHDSFVVAAARIHQLRDPDRLRPWLYAIVRSECLRSLRGSAREVAFEEWHDIASDTEPEHDVHRGEIRQLVRDALGGLSPKDREIVELALRHDLDNAEIAAVLGVKPSHVTALTSRSRKALERSLGTLLVARASGVGCEDLTQILEPWDGQWTPLWRKRIGKHIDDCPVCTGERRRRFSPAAILVALPVVAVPVGLKLRTVADAQPQLVAFTQHAGQAHASTMPNAQTAPPAVTLSGVDAADPSARATGTTIAGQVAWTYPIADPPPRRWLLWLGAAALLVVALAGSVFLLTALDGPDPIPAVDTTAPTNSVTTATGQQPQRTSSEAPGAAPGSQVPGGPAARSASSEVIPQSPSSGNVSSPVVPDPDVPDPDPDVSNPAVPDPAGPQPQIPGVPDPSIECPGCSGSVPPWVVPANPPPVIH